MVYHDVTETESLKIVVFCTLCSKTYGIILGRYYLLISIRKVHFIMSQKMVRDLPVWTSWLWPFPFSPTSLTVEVLRNKGPNLSEDRDPIFERGSTTTYSSFRKGSYTKPWSSQGQSI